MVIISVITTGSCISTKCEMFTNDRDSSRYIMNETQRVYEHFSNMEWVKRNDFPVSVDMKMECQASLVQLSVEDCDCEHPTWATIQVFHKYIDEDGQADSPTVDESEYFRPHKDNKPKRSKHKDETEETPKETYGPLG